MYLEWGVLFMISHLNQVMLLRESRLKNGIDIIELSNGILHVTLNVSRALDIYQILYHGKNVSFLSKNGLNNKTGAFSERFEGGMLYTCGLDAIGNKENHTQHGQLHLQSAQITRAEVSEEEILVEAKVSQTSLYGNHFILHRSVRLKKNAFFLELIDTLQNASWVDAKYVMLYHFNFGYPFLDESTLIHIESKKQEGATPFAQENLSQFHLFSKSIQKEEQVIYHEDLQSFPVVQGQFANITLKYDRELFPYLIEWKSMVSGDYALGIEPSTSKFNDQLIYHVLKPKEQKTHHFILAFEDKKDLM